MRAPVTRGIIGVSSLVYAAQVVAGSWLNSKWLLAGAVEVNNPQWWQLLTYIWVHGNPLHLLLNMWVLWSFAPHVEERFGGVGFAIIYLWCGFCAAWCSVGWLPAGSVVLGSSGAIFAVLAMYCLMFWRAKVKWLFWPRPIPTWVLLVVLAVLEGVLWWQRVPSAIVHLAGLLLGFWCWVGYAICQKTLRKRLPD